MSDKQRILIVDDTASNIKILNDLLHSDYNISVATNGPDALELAVSQVSPDLILLDIMMPGMDGYQFLNAVKQDKDTKDIPVIILSSLSRESDILEGLERGAADYITKPFSPPVLISKIKKIME